MKKNEKRDSKSILMPFHRCDWRTRIPTSRKFVGIMRDDSYGEREVWAKVRAGATRGMSLGNVGIWAEQENFFVNHAVASSKFEIGDVFQGSKNVWVHVTFELISNNDAMAGPKLCRNDFKHFSLKPC